MQLLGRTCGREAPLLRKSCLEIACSSWNQTGLTKQFFRCLFRFMSTVTWWSVWKTNRRLESAEASVWIRRAGFPPDIQAQRHKDGVRVLPAFYLHLFLKEKIDWQHHSVKWPLCAFSGQRSADSSQWAISSGPILLTQQSDLNEWINKVS